MIKATQKFVYAGLLIIFWFDSEVGHWDAKQSDVDVGRLALEGTRLKTDPVKLDESILT